MPEMTYTFLFALLSWVVAIILPARMLSGAVLSGVVVGTMLLTKPHALALFLGTCLTFAALFVAPSSIRPTRRRLLAMIPLFMLSSYVTVVCMNGVIAQRLELSPLAFVGAIYVPYVARDLSAVSLLGKLPRLLAILGGHLIVFGTFVALGAARGGSELRRLYTTRTALDDGDRVRFLLIVFTGCATLWTIAMTVYFTAQATNVVPTDYFRLHGRYYSFVIPLYLVLFFGLSRDSAEADAKDSWLLTGTIIGCGLSGTAVLRGQSPHDLSIRLSRGGCVFRLAWRTRVGSCDPQRRRRDTHRDWDCTCGLRGHAVAPASRARRLPNPPHRAVQRQHRQSHCMATNELDQERRTAGGRTIHAEAPRGIRA